MKRNIYKNISLAVLALLATACQNNDELGSAYDNDPNAVVVNASIGARTQTRVSTESATADKWDNGDSFCVKGGANSNMAMYTYNGTTWTIGSDYLTWNTTDTNDFTAWYPVSATYTTFTLPKKQGAGIGKADWMTASKTGISKPANKQLNLEFSHKLSKVIVNVTEYSDEYSGAIPPTISNVKLYVAGTPSVSGATVESSATFITPLIDAKNNDLYYTAIMLPGTYSNGATFMEMSVTPYNNSTKTLTVEVPNALTSTGLVAGKSYTYNLKIGKGKVSIASVSVAEWGTSNMGSGTATEGPAGPAVGEFYYKDGTHSVDYQGTQSNSCIGVVIDVEKGLILSDQLSIGKASWATKAGEKVKTRTTNADGRDDVTLLRAISSDLSQYPVAKACDDYDVGGKGWYLPSETEVKGLKGDVESAAKWKNIFTAAGFTGTNTSSDDAFWTTTVDPENDEQFNYVYYMGWTGEGYDFKYIPISDQQYMKYVRCVKRVSL